LHLRHNNYFAF